MATFYRCIKFLNIRREALLFSFYFHDYDQVNG